MREASVQLFESYLKKCNGAVDRALAETVQSIALLGLSRGGFFSDAAKADVLPFVPQARDLDVWSKDYFRHVLKNMKFKNKVA
jgi:hypothetical protein